MTRKAIKLLGDWRRKSANTLGEVLYKLISPFVFESIAVVANLLVKRHAFFGCKEGTE